MITKPVFLPDLNVVQNLLENTPLTCGNISVGIVKTYKKRKKIRSFVRTLFYDFFCKPATEKENLNTTVNQIIIIFG